jgi:hypothetical protein
MMGAKITVPEVSVNTQVAYPSTVTFDVRNFCVTRPLRGLHHSSFHFNETIRSVTGTFLIYVSFILT